MTVVGLVGKRCTLEGELNDHSVDALWDVGAQVSIISNEFLRNFPDCHSIRRIQEMLDNWELLVSVIDQGKAYHQGFVSPNSQPATAPWGLYECVRMPFDLSRATGVFQRFRENCLGDLDTVCVPG